MPDSAGRPAPTQTRLLRRVLRRFVRLSATRRFLLIEAVLWLAVSRLALVFLPFRMLAARFGKVAAPAAGEPRYAIGADDSIQAREIGWAVTRAARYVPFRAVCLPQAIAAKAMLSRRGVASVMHFGVTKKPGEDLAAHAWLDAGSVDVTGFPVGPEFVEVARFL